VSLYTLNPPATMSVGIVGGSMTAGTVYGPLELSEGRTFSS